MNEEKLKQNFAKNLAFYRKKSGLTQLELAEKLNYTDKSVSKWERGDGLPDVLVVATLAELFGVGIDDMFCEEPNIYVSTHRNKILTAVLACGVAWLVATVMFFAFNIFAPNIFKAWLFFIYAISASAIIMTVFSKIWWNKIVRFFSVSSLIWSITLCLVLSVPVPKISQIFVIAGVVQVLALFWFLLKRKPKK